MIISITATVLVRVVGLEPTRLAAQEPKSCVSTNSTIPAYASDRVNLSLYLASFLFRAIRN